MRFFLLLLYQIICEKANKKCPAGLLEKKRLRVFGFLIEAWLLSFRFLVIWGVG
jgi:hypothetical protein